MALETTTFKHGGVVYPLTAVTANSLLKDADPAIFYVLEFYASVLTTYIGARLAAEATLAGLTIASPVGYQLPTDPAAYLTEEQTKFPLLAVYRVRETLRDRTITWRQDVAEWKVAYVLPPLTPGQRERLSPILRAVGRVLDNRTELGFDTAYASGAKILASSYANLESIEVKNATYADWDAGGDLVFPSVLLTLEVKERGAPVTGAYEALVDVDTNIDNTAASETTVSNAVQIRTET